MTPSRDQQNVSAYDRYATNDPSFHNDSIHYKRNLYLSPLDPFSHFFPTSGGEMDFWNDHYDYQNDITTSTTSTTPALYLIIRLICNHIHFGEWIITSWTCFMIFH